MPPTETVFFFGRLLISFALYATTVVYGDDVRQCVFLFVHYVYNCRLLLLLLLYTRIGYLNSKVFERCFSLYLYRANYYRFICSIDGSNTRFSVYSFHIILLILFLQQWCGIRLIKYKKKCVWELDISCSIICANWLTKMFQTLYHCSFFLCYQAPVLKELNVGNFKTWKSNLKNDWQI